MMKDQNPTPPGRVTRRACQASATGFAGGCSLSAEKGISGAVSATGNEPSRRILPVGSAVFVGTPHIALILAFLV